MYGIEIVTPPASSPVTAAALRARLRLNDSAEDADLADFLAAAVELFEHDTGRPVVATTYRQHLSRWPWGPAVPAGPTPALGWPAAELALGGLVPGRPAGEIVLGRGGVTSVAGVFRNLADGTSEAVPGYSADLNTPPARVRLAAPPAPVVTAAGVPVSPVGYVEFTAGWAGDQVPALVRTALMLLAAHYYEHREAFEAATLTDLPMGWCRLVARYKTGVSGDWGQ